MKPPRLPLNLAPELGIHEQSLSRINRGIKPPGIKLGAAIAKTARTRAQVEADICDWVPVLLDPEIWPELVFAVKRRQRQR